MPKFSKSKIPSVRETSNPIGTFQHYPLPVTIRPAQEEGVKGCKGCVFYHKTHSNCPERGSEERRLFGDTCVSGHHIYVVVQQ